MSTRIFTTLAAAQSATGLKDNDICYLAGSSVVGDSGAGWYGYSKAATDNASSDVIIVTGGGRLLRATDPSSDYATEIAAATNTALRATALQVTGSTVDSSAIATAIDGALRATPLMVASGFTRVVTTLVAGTEVEVILDGVSLPRSIAVSPAAGDTVRLRFRYTAAGAWFHPSETLAITAATSDDGKLHSLDRPVYSMGITRTVGAGTTSTVVIA